MARSKSAKKNNPRKRRVLVTFVVAAFLILAAAALRVLSELKPPWLPAWPWLATASLILGALAMAVPVLGALFSDILLPLIDHADPPRRRVQKSCVTKRLFCRLVTTR